MVPLLLSLMFKCVLILLCMVTHEIGHILVARYYHVPVKKIGLNWMGMYIQRARTTGWPEISTCLAGATMNLVLAIVFWNILPWFALCSLTFAWVNILPIPHSDGQHALEAYEAMHRTPTTPELHRKKAA
ncbi:MAG TPA: M50 family metallopeptidase [Silvibacterium sp.]|nr:M50 family metallopeptidase [Silvibacterium sp.]